MKVFALAALTALALGACSNPDGTDSFRDSMDSKPDKENTTMNPSSRSDTMQDYETNYPHDSMPQD